MPGCPAPVETRGRRFGVPDKPLISHPRLINEAASERNTRRCGFFMLAAGALEEPDTMSTKPSRRMRRKRRGAKPIDLAAIEHKAAFTKQEFCARNNISIATFNNYQTQCIGPAVTQAKRGGRVTITREAETAWHQRLQANPIPRRGRPRKDDQGVPGVASP
jgi:hypothetical protein